MGNRAKIREEARKLNPIDDTMFQVMAEKNDFCQEILRVILQDSDLLVLQNKTQRELRNLQGRSVELDLDCILGDGTQVAVEVQKSDLDDHQRRVRYNTACLTTNTTDPGQCFKEIPDIISVFISKFDIFHQNKTVYHVDRIIRETSMKVYNGLSEVYVNASVDDGSDIADLMKLFVDDEYYDDGRYPVSSREKRYLKKDEGGLSRMCEIVERLRDEARAEGLAEGLAQGETNIILSLIRQEIITPAQGAAQLGISVDQIRQLLASPSDE